LRHRQRDTHDYKAFIPMKQKILISGAAGFIGFHLSRRLLNDGHEVIGLDSLNEYYDVRLKEARLAQLTPLPGFRFIQQHLEEREKLHHLFAVEKFDSVVNLAAQPGVRYSLTNPYACIDSNIVGFMNILEGTPIDVFNHGNMRRDFTFIDDIIEGVVRVIDRIPKATADWSGARLDPGTSYAPYTLYNIGNNTPVELMHFINVLEECLGKKAAKNMLPLQAGDVRATYADIDDLMRDVGFKPNTPIEEGIKQFVDWYRSYYGDQR